LAERIPFGSDGLVQTHDDDAGNRYAWQVKSTLPKRAILRRAAWNATSRTGWETDRSKKQPRRAGPLPMTCPAAPACLTCSLRSALRLIVPSTEPPATRSSTTTRAGFVLTMSG